MRYLTFTAEEFTEYGICFLSPEIHLADMQRLYVEPHLSGWEEHLLAYTLHKGPKRTPSGEQKDYLNQLLPILRNLDTRYLVVCDAEYFRTMTKQSGEASLGYVIPGEDDYAGFNIVYCPNFRSVFYNPAKVKGEITQALYALKTHIQGTYCEPGIDIIKFAAYPETPEEIQSWLDKLIEMDCDLSSDIESFSLKHYDAGVGTITFCWSKHEGIAFPVDLGPDGEAVRAMLRDFFYRFRRKMIWHNITYDVTVLIYQLFMKDLLDQKGLQEGLRVMLQGPGGWDDTKIITYLATNSCAGNKLGLKYQAQEFSGQYAVEGITDIRSIPLPDLLQYNLIDGLSTWFVHEKHWDTMVADQQLDIYENLLKPSVIDVIQMQLTGLPMDMQEVHRLKDKLETYAREATEKLQSNPHVQMFIEWQTEQAWIKDFEDRKVKAKNPAKIKQKDRATFPVKPFNPGSGPQLQKLLYDEQFMGLPVLDLTDTKQPATGGETIEKLVHKTTNDDIEEFLRALVDYKSVETILSNFVPKFLEAKEGPDGWHYLFGNFNIGGTVSGRMSSSGPNLQNLPSSGTRWAKDVKRCFKAPPGYLFIGLDFASLEDRISALTTRDPNKLKVYTDGYDGHSLRAYSYFDDQMPDIDPDSVESINSIQELYKPLRQDSKTPTFLLTYGGTWMGIVDKMGWTPEKAKTIEAKYHQLYRVSDEWVAERIQEASKCGYVTVAFGLRVRTPLLKQVIRGNSKTPYEAEAEARTAGNALGQSYGLLNNRASVEFMSKVRSGEYVYDIRPCAHIHDAQYYMIPEDLAVLLYVNEHLVRAVEWQDDPAIWHDQVKLGGELSIFFPTWAEEMAIPNNATEDQIKELASKHHKKYCGG